MSNVSSERTVSEEPSPEDFPDSVRPEPGRPATPSSGPEDPSGPDAGADGDASGAADEIERQAALSPDEPDGGSGGDSADRDGADGDADADGKVDDAVDKVDEKSDGEKSDEEADGEKAPADPFSAFAPEPEVVPGRVGRIGRRTGSGLARFFSHEWTLAVLGSIALAVVMTWPALAHPASTIPQDIWDPTLQAWQMSWAGHILTTDPLRLWQANAFYPDQYSYAFSDTLLGYAPAGMIGSGPVAAIVRYNIIFVLIFAFAFFGAYALVRQLGAGRTGAAVAGAAFAYAPWRLGQAGHLHVLSIGGIALALAMLARGHGFSLRKGYEPDKRRWGWVLGGWLVAAWQISLGFGIGIPFAYALLLIVVVTALVWGVRSIWRWGCAGRSAGSCSSPTSAAGSSSPG
ncbi:ICP22 family protein [Dactylosporangium darangshiense]|uniref:hypothetical protein n=1 Tax=Dactylosporangium darangshiense TaxID=579108 RepID=UPI00363587B5